MNTLPHKHIWGIAACLLLILIMGKPGLSQTIETGIITADRIHIRSAPGSQNPSVAILRQGAQVEVLSHEGKYVKVKHADKVGYIRNRSRYIRIDSAGAQPDRQPASAAAGVKAEDYQRKAEQLRRDLKRQEEQVREFTKNEAAIVGGLNDIDRALNRTRKQVSALQSDLLVLEVKIRKNRLALKALKSRIARSEKYVAGRLVSLYKMNQLGKVQVFASAASLDELFRRKYALEKILDHDETVRLTLLENKASLERIRKELKAQRDEKVTVESAYKKQLALMRHKKQTRTKLLADIRNKRSLGLAAIDALKEASASLDRQIKTLESAPEPSRPTVQPAGKPFTAYKGLLKKPVNGKIISTFGKYRNSRFNTVNFRSGIEIEAERGEPIRAVSRGRTIFSSWFKGFGNMIILDHGHHYYTVYAHAEEIFKGKGDIVEAGEVIATVGDTGSLTGPALYFEIRHHGKPMNPLKWIKRG